MARTLGDLGIGQVHPRDPPAQSATGRPLRAKTRRSGAFGPNRSDDLASDGELSKPFDSIFAANAFAPADSERYHQEKIAEEAPAFHTISAFVIRISGAAVQWSA
jgi:hypothetical protein